MRNTTLILAAALCAALTACSESPSTKTAEKKEAEKVEPVTGQTALYRMYQSARTWAPDAEVLTCTNMHITDAPDGPRESGAMPAWQAVFTSATRNEARTYNYAVLEASGNLHKGAFAGSSESWSQHGFTSPFLIAAVKVDTDAAFKTAMEKAGEYDKKNPGLPITYVLEKTQKHPDPAWRVVWGENVQTSGFSVLVDASTGAYLETVH
ncbi:MAG: hypothetical protein KGN36_15045 [Acidobacteriota bacterium]|nr:hypothetical protein [Acidobacteriota bacterium]